MTTYYVVTKRTNKPKTINVSNDIAKSFEEFTEIMKSKNIPVTLQDIFYAGYICSNPVVRQKLLKNRKQLEQIENKTDNRIQNTIWK